MLQNQLNCGKAILPLLVLMAGERSPSFCSLLCAEDEVSITAFHGVVAGLWLRCPGPLE